MNTEKWLDWRYDQRNANCWHFVQAVWADITGKQLMNVGPDGLHLQQMALKRLDAPQSPCLVLMQRQRIEPHVGVYVAGRVLHCNKFGASFQPLDHVSVGYPTVSYYTNP